LPVGLLLASIAGLALIGSVLASVHHAEVVAHRVGEPFGTLILAVAVTVIEVALIVSMMLAGGPDKSALPRDTIFSAIMIICNGAVGLCVVVGGLRHHEQSFRLEGATAALAALIALATLSLVLPTFTTSSPGASYTPKQLAFAAVASLVLWGVFVFVQTIRHRDYFLPPRGAGRRIGARAAAFAEDGLGELRPSARLAGGGGSAWPSCSRRRSSEAVDAVGCAGDGDRHRHRPARAVARERGRPCAPRAPTACRRASTSRSARRWRASA
jgi:Ca2+:H+ antiporter